MQEVAPFIDGKPRAPSGSSRITAVNPANGRICFEFQDGSEADADQAVSSAREAFDNGHWNDAGPGLRKLVLHKLADSLLVHACRLDAWDAEEMGKPIAEPFCNAAAAAELMRFYAEAAELMSVNDKQDQ